MAGMRNVQSGSMKRLIKEIKCSMEESKNEKSDPWGLGRETAKLLQQVAGEREASVNLVSRD
eukprot:4821807-Prorocentrum_lima.AAC.1